MLAFLVILMATPPLSAAFREVSETFDKDTMPVHSDPELEAIRERRAARKKKGISLQDCFAETAKTEILSENNTWRCPRCKEERMASKTLEIYTVPDILIVHLKRFGGSRAFHNSKLTELVDFPIEGLDVGPWIGLKEDKEAVYDLFAVDNHYGGLGGGHYTAFAQNFYDKRWYEYNGTSPLLSRTPCPSSPNDTLTLNRLRRFHPPTHRRHLRRRLPPLLPPPLLYPFRPAIPPRHREPSARSRL